MILEILWQLLLIAMAIVYSNYARLPVMVACYIVVFSLVQFAAPSIASMFHVPLSIDPYTSIKYIIDSLFLAGVSVIFFRVRDKFYFGMGCALVFGSIISLMMVGQTYFEPYHRFFSDKVTEVETLLVWISSVRRPCKTSKK
jgi:hypothetical protein